MLDVAALAGLFAKLIGLGIAAWETKEESGWGKADAQALAQALGVLQELPSGGGTKATVALQSCELTLVAFGEAWRRHWLYDAKLAPARFKSKWTDWLGSNAVRRRIAQVETRLRQARLEPPTLGDAGPEEQLASFEDLLADPVASHWYRALWDVFSDRSLDDAADEPLLLNADGFNRRSFERHFRLAFREGLCSQRATELRRWRQDQQQGATAAELVRELLAAKLLALKEEHVFGDAGMGPEVPAMPLFAIYVEPLAELQHHGGRGESSRAQTDRAEKRSQDPEPILSLLHRLLEDDATRVVVVTAPFGMGKSLTARTLAYQLAEKFLNEPTTTPDLDFPILVPCQECLRAEEFDLDKVVRRAQKRLATPLLPSADQNHPGLGMPPPEQHCVVLLDGLDEVHLSPTTVVDLFRSLVDAATDKHRFVVLGRPQVVSEQALRLDGITSITLCEFSYEQSGSTSQVERWLENWSQLNPGRPAPTRAQLEERSLLDLCATPILLFMVSLSWSTLEHEGKVPRSRIYQSFIELLARSKFRADGEHSVVQRAAETLRKRLVDQKQLPASATAVDATIWLLAGVAWRGHALRHQTDDRPLSSDDVRDILRNLGLQGDDLDLAQLGLLLTLHSNPGGGARDLRFSHESFREFMVAKFWQSRLAVILGDNQTAAKTAEAELSEARLLREGDQSFTFLRELLALEPEARRLKIVDWASRCFNDESLDAGATLREDRRSQLRESALAIGSCLSEVGIAAEHPRTLRSLLAWFFAVGQSPYIVAPQLSSPGAILEDANLADANLAGANLVGANLVGANLADAYLVDAHLEDAHLERAYLERAYLPDAHLEGAHLERAHLRGAFLLGAHLGAHDPNDLIRRGALGLSEDEDDAPPETDAGS